MWTSTTLYHGLPLSPISSAWIQSLIWNMELERSSGSVRVLLGALIILLLHQHGEAQKICSVPGDPIMLRENTTIGFIIATVTIQEGVTLLMTQNPLDAFELRGQDLVTAKVLDYESLPPEGPGLIVHIDCKKSITTEQVMVIIILEDVNDNPPGFEQSSFRFNVNELTPIGTSVFRVEAHDVDSKTLYYRLEPEGDGYFKLQSQTNPNILVAKDLDCEIIQTQTFGIYVQDFAPPELEGFSSSATITVNIVDIDNRPPWFQPCTILPMNSPKICISSGYSGTVNLTQHVLGPLLLKPGPVYAVDGDTGINDIITYSIIGGNEHKLFQINSQSGNITMLKAVDVPGPITLTVLAYQVLNKDQFATTTVTFTVVKRSRHPPTFMKQHYEGYISSDSDLDSMVLERNSNRPLRVQATDEDFSSGINPDVKYEIPDSGDFAVTAEGFVLLKTDMMPSTVDLQVLAVDSSSGEVGTTMLSVEILPVSTVSTAPTDSTSTPLPSTPTPSEGAVMRTGEYRMEDMAALGASLAGVVLLCLVIISLLTFRIRKGKADWQKLTEATIFRSSFTQGSAGPKENLEYINDGFQNDGDTGSMSKVPDEIDLKLDMISAGKAKEASSSTTPVTSQTLYSTFLHDTSSVAGSEKADSEKEVKPILTKERRNEEGYKSVWFKEDIDPNAKEEVVIIPDNGEREDDEDEDSFVADNSSPVIASKVRFVDAKKNEKSEGKNTASAPEEEDGVDL